MPYFIAVSPLFLKKITRQLSGGRQRGGRAAAGAMAEQWRRRQRGGGGGRVSSAMAAAAAQRRRWRWWRWRLRAVGATEDMMFDKVRHLLTYSYGKLCRIINFYVGNEYILINRRFRE
jgi:hypothetical protein